MGFKNSILGAGALLVAASSQAAVVAYDDFASNGSLAGSAGGSGFSDAWSEGQYTVSDGVVSGTGNAFRGLENAFGSNGTIWVSFDMGRSAAGDSYGGLSFFGGTTNEYFMIGDWYKQGVWGMDKKTGAQPIKTYGTISIDGIKTAVAKITLGAGASSLVELWVGENNVDVVECGGVPDATLSGVTLEGVDTLRIGAGFSMDFADLVLGDTAADVGASLGDETVFAASVSGLWSNAANWSDGVPTATDDATIDLGADVTLDTFETVAFLALKNATTLTLAGGELTSSGLSIADSVMLEITADGSATVGSDVTLNGSTTLTLGVGSGTSGELNAGGVLDLGSAALYINGEMDSFEQIIFTATGGITNAFVNMPNTAYVQNAGGYNYYIHYVTNATPNYIVINTNGVQSGDGGVVIPPRPEEDLMVAGYDQRYMAYDYDVVTGTWTDYVGTATAEAINATDFSITTNTPNGRPAVVNAGSIGVNTAMNFTRASAVATNGFTIQAVIRIDAGNTDSRQGPFSCDEATGWSGLYMGAQAGSTSQIRAGNIGDTRSGTYVLAGSGANTVDAGTWGIYTLVVDPETTPQMSATFDLLMDGTTAFAISATVPSTTNWVGGISASGRLFGGDMGGGADGDTDNWQGAIADLVVYNRPLTSEELASNEVAFQSIYVDEIVYPVTIGDVSIEAVPGGNEVVVTWETSLWGTFALESTESIVYPSWSDVATGIPGTGSEVSITDTTTTGVKFYRAYIED